MGLKNLRHFTNPGVNAWASGKATTIVFEIPHEPNQTLSDFSAHQSHKSPADTYKVVAVLTARNTNVGSWISVLAISREIYRKQKNLNYTSRLQTM